MLRTAAPAAHVLIQALLPRGGAFVGLEQWQWPNRFTKPLAAVNARFQVRQEEMLRGRLRSLLGSFPRVLACVSRAVHLGRCTLQVQGCMTAHQVIPTAKTA
jgi:hypothetical protein